MKNPETERCGACGYVESHDPNCPRLNPYCLPAMVKLRDEASSVCNDPDCDLSGGYAHAGPCERCACPMEHAIAECPAADSTRLGQEP